MSFISRGLQVLFLHGLASDPFAATGISGRTPLVARAFLPMPIGQNRQATGIFNFEQRHVRTRPHTNLSAFHTPVACQAVRRLSNGLPPE
jgi:hypothetical protein